MRLDLEASPAAPSVFDSASRDEFDSYRNAARLLKRGVFAAQSGDRDTARKLLTQVVALDPASEDAWMWLASISDYPEELMAFLDRVLAINADNERAVEWHAATTTLMAKTFVKRAIAAHQDGDPAFADQCIEQALAHDVKCVDAWLWRASIVSNEDERIECLERVIDIDPENADAADALRQIAERHEEERRIEQERIANEARLAAEEARREEERRAEESRQAEELRVAALFDEAKAAALTGDNAKALVLVHAFLASHGDNAEAWVFCSHLSESVEEKLASLEKALAIDPNNTAAKSGYDFLSSMAAPKSEHSMDEMASNVAHDVPVAEVSAVEVAASQHADQNADVSMPEVEEYFDEDVAEPTLASVDVERNENGHDPYATMDYSSDPHAPEPPFDAVAEVAADGVACPFCDRYNPPNAFECGCCNAFLTLSDLEAVLANSAVDRTAVSRAVVHMEGEWNEREFSIAELTNLALGHLNLGSFDAGRSYLQEALQRDQNNVVLAGQLNALSIRLDEINRQREIDDARPKGKMILVVDDSATVRKLISGKLEKSGHNVVCASDGIEALERMTEQIPDLVLLDITMPRMDGYEVCKQIRANSACSNVPVVMISGKDGFFDKVRGRMAGTTGYVTKPFGPETLMRALETYLLPDASAAVFQPEPELEPVV